MAKYRSNLPQLENRTFLSDGGMETTLIFRDGVELPHFASFVLLDTEDGRRRLKSYYEKYLHIARQHGVGFVLDSATWRANPDWGVKLGCDANRLKAVNIASVRLLEELRAEWETGSMPCVISGVVGPRGDGYKAGSMNVSEAEAYHSPQIATFAETSADMVAAYTLTNVDEAVGIARAARTHAMPCMISFTVETDGRLVSGKTLREAIETVDRETDAYPGYYMINCAHPTHFENVLHGDGDWLHRIRGLRANASKRSHAELDASTTLDAGDAEELGQMYGALHASLPKLSVVGGCCGTDHRHVASMCRAMKHVQRNSLREKSGDVIANR